mmetsp:Transcript_9317/g.23331  ORF Transcript_9317/g.23331 Transcript_9317/m.23331 type:complete len:224 (-) Transcript_9317:582-1253(-)
MAMSLDRAFALAEASTPALASAPSRWPAELFFGISRFIIFELDAFIVCRSDDIRRGNTRLLLAVTRSPPAPSTSELTEAVLTIALRTLERRRGAFFPSPATFLSLSMLKMLVISRGTEADAARPNIRRSCSWTPLLISDHGWKNEWYSAARASGRRLTLGHSIIRKNDFASDFIKILSWNSRSPLRMLARTSSTRTASFPKGIAPARQKYSTTPSAQTSIFRP